MADRIITSAQIFLSVLLMATVLLQQRGTGLGGAFGSEGNVYRTRRGAEKFLFYSTIVLAVLFAAVSIVHLLI